MLRIFFICLMALMMGCQVGNGAPSTNTSIVHGRDISAHVGLREAMEQYYSAESRGDWRSTYMQRPMAFRRIVPFDTYQRKMQEGYAGWKLLKAEILDATSESNDEVLVKVRFQESFSPEVAKSRFEGRIPSGINTRVEETLWKWVGTSWLAVQPGQRGHLPLNVRIAR